ncbi:pyrroloquinoline quinone precursor peptide PqqA [Actinomadura montaniterrae]|uniref:Coenzyme PQQ synthesis protein A n=1 Tax=Actinomadura montaniterrae TaxID=1803903 RepID=A0A6L3W579_9ACTN|nr:pyrroloquinoline quinone precursor peptide PqqA [Actinomadura montaniterrae]KAB2384500.1 pyrroloquinoline quinone precursor peptide PqqA [Actinomadura montaniterrae]
MTQHLPDAQTAHTDLPDGQAQGAVDQRTASWSTPDYQVVETSLEVTAYFGVEI